MSLFWTPEPKPRDPPAIAPATWPLCISCGYDLSGLNPEGVCPECGAAIERSRRGDRLRHMDPARLRRLVSGAGWIKTAVSVWYIGLILLVLFIIVFSFLSSAPVFMPMSALSVVLLGVATSWAYGWWLVQGGTAEPHEPRGIRRWRHAARLGLAGGALAMAVFIPVSSAGTVATGWTLSLVAASGVALLAVHLVALCAHVRWLARRIPDPPLGRRAAAVSWFLLIAAGAVLLSAVRIALIPGGAPRWMGAVLGYTPALFAISCILLLLAVTELAFKLHATLRAELTAAQESNEPPSPADSVPTAETVRNTAHPPAAGPPTQR
jgi:predicted RNA-binding Zn-ribbon protein involved in translation (DUF1610 family)